MTTWTCDDCGKPFTVKGLTGFFCPECRRKRQLKEDNVQQRFPVKSIYLPGLFIGESSCGFVYGQYYTVSMSFDSSNIWIKDIVSGAVCPYSSIQTLAKNWLIPARKGK